jgi:hypothetical protein
VASSNESSSFMPTACSACWSSIAIRASSICCGSALVA